MPDVKLRDVFPKNLFTRAFVEGKREEQRAIPGVLDCEIEEDDTNFVLTTTYPDPNETDQAPAPAAPASPAPASASASASAGAQSFPTPRDAIGLCIATWEGLWQDNPADSGNYAQAADGSVRLVGTMRGITPNAFARFQGIDPGSVTANMLKNQVSQKVAVDIAMQDYFLANNFDRLLWCPVVDSTFDAMLMSGPGRAVKMIQQLVGADQDGGIGPQTAEALDLFLESHDIQNACDQFAAIRIAFYESISEPGTKNAQFRQGWINRANWARPANEDWWARWRGWTMPHPAGSSKATGPAPTAAAALAPAISPAAATGLGPYIAPNPEAQLHQVVDNGQCVRYVQVAAGAPHTSKWRPGALVKGNASIKRGTAIATFDPDGGYGNHTDGRSHAAIYISQDTQALHVIDQWVDHPVQPRPIWFGHTPAVNDGNAFQVIL